MPEHPALPSDFPPCDTRAPDDGGCPALADRSDNHVAAGAHFARRFGRWPVPVHDPNALINDYIFDRMIDPVWTTMERAVVDKATAKAEALKLSPNIRVPDTLAIISIDDLPSSEALFAALSPFIGRPAIAKPTHASGGVVYLEHLSSPQQLDGLFTLASIDYSTVLREMQYHGLKRQIIVETLVPTLAGQSPDDYKFHCVDGEAILCQIDHSRFDKPWSRLLKLPDLAPFDEADGLAWPMTYRQPTSERTASMIEIARSLSRPFRFVRVDLYDSPDGIYFGEWTFSPAAALGIAPSAAGDHAVNPTHLAYSEAMMSAIKLVKIPGGR